MRKSGVIGRNVERGTDKESDRQASLLALAVCPSAISSSKKVEIKVSHRVSLTSQDPKE